MPLAKLVADITLSSLGLPLPIPVVSLLSGSDDRPIGATPSGNQGAGLPNTTVILTREIIERALAQPPLLGTMVEQTLLFLPKPGIMVIPVVDGMFNDAIGAGFLPQAVYLMVLQVERLP